jgi:hypothetical protein
MGSFKPQDLSNCKQRSKSSCQRINEVDLRATDTQPEEQAFEHKMRRRYLEYLKKRHIVGT